MEGEFVTIQDLGDPSYTRKVSLLSFNGWPKSKDVEGARLAQGGKRVMVIVTEEQAQTAKERPAIRIPDVVTNAKNANAGQEDQPDEALAKSGKKKN